jgi:hypothetical protein
MAKRLWAFALSFVIIGAPVAAVACEVTCASPGKGAMGGHEHHRSCSTVTVVASVAINAPPHACGHSSEDTVGVQQSCQVLPAPDLMAAVTPLLPAIDSLARAKHIARAKDSPPGILTRPTQLRV